MPAAGKLDQRLSRAYAGGNLTSSVVGSSAPELAAVALKFIK